MRYSTIPRYTHMAAPPEYSFRKRVLRQSIAYDLNVPFGLHCASLRNQPRLTPTDLKCRNQDVPHSKPGTERAQTRRGAEPNKIVTVKGFKVPGHMQVSDQGIHAGRDVRYGFCDGAKAQIVCGSGNKQDAWNYPGR
jgi:hypothetical protein